MRRSPASLAVVAALAALARPEAAAAASEPPAGATTLFEALTVVGSKVEERVGEIAGTATVIARAELDFRQVQRLEDVVRDEPGVSAVGQAGRFGFQAFRIRGVDGNRVALELDGVPAPAAFAVGSFASAGRDVVEPELVRSVEILRGPASALHGSDALGGVVVLTTRSPADLLEAAPDAAATLTLGADGRDEGVRASALGAAASGAWQVLGLVATRHGAELDNRGDVPPDPATRDERAGVARVVRLFGSGLVELLVDRQESSVETDVDHLERGPGQFASTVALDASDRVERSRAVLQLVLATSRSSLVEARGRLYWSDVATEQRTWQERAADSRAPHPTRRWREFELAETAVGAEWMARAEAAAGDSAHRIVWGVELESSDVRERRDGREFDLTTGSTTSTVLGESLPVRDFPPSRVRRYAGFVTDDVAVGRWRLQPALRWQRTATAANADGIYRGDFPTTRVVEVDDSSWTPKFGLQCDLSGGHSVYAQVAEGFRSPPFYDVNVGLRIAAFGYEAIPNPDLRPERSRGVELGWRRAGAVWSAQVAVFENRYRDLIESRANLGRDPESGLTIFQSVNRDRARIRGLEARARLDLGRLARVVNGWTLDASLAVAEGEDRRRRVPLNSVDPDQLTVTLGYRPPSARWAWSGIGRWTADKRGEVDSSAVDVFAPPASTVVDLYGEWRPAARWSVQIALLNAFDAKYWVFGKVRGVLADDPQLDFHTEPGRSWLVTAAWRR